MLSKTKKIYLFLCVAVMQDGDEVNWTRSAALQKVCPGAAVSPHGNQNSDTSAQKMTAWTTMTPPPQYIIHPPNPCDPLEQLSCGPI